MPDLLIELFSEEIPARMQRRAADDLQKLVTNGLVEAGLTYAHAAAFSTPRRLTLALEGLTAESPDTVEERKGPKTSAPDKALEGFLRATGLTKDQLQVRDDKKGQVYIARISNKGRPAAEIVAEVLDACIRNFPWPKSMRWGNGTLRWVRPLHRILCILSDEEGAQVVPLTVDGITASDKTEGHRFMAPGEIAVASFDDYSTKLKRAFVVLNPDDRAQAIWNDATNMAFAKGLEVVDDKGLLAEVAGLVEWPVVLLGQIADDYLSLPPEVLQTSMREHQKFFSVRNPKTDRIEGFVTVANRDTADNGATILEGNTRVLSARLADGKFFWDNDLRVAKGQKMQPWIDALENVTFHNRLGSQAERISRIRSRAGPLAMMVGADYDQAQTAAGIAKADLSSEMVYEFPELQGIMGRYYALEAGHSEDIANVARNHYAPLGPSDDVPTEPLSVTVALADKIDMLSAFWYIRETPTGSKDPFALRRAALGVIRLVLENQLKLPLRMHFEQGLHLLMSQSDARLQELEKTLPEGQDNEAELRETLGDVECYRDIFADKVLAFLHDRLKTYLKDRDIAHDVIDACLAMPGNDDLTLLVKRATALQATLNTDDGTNLLQGFKRANNILSQAEEKDGVEYSYGADVKFSETEEEKTLFAALDAAEAKITPAMQAEDFTTAMSAMAALRQPIDAFFEGVQINADSEILRRNRLNLLSRIRTIILSVADLTKIQG